jgi:hypothetical protein
MKNKKISVILAIVVALIAIAIVVIFVIYRKNNNKKITNKPGFFIEKDESSKPAKIDFKDIGEADIGDKVSLGEYEGEEIAWNVLDKDSKSLMLISTYFVAQMPYHNEVKDITWEKSDIRKWLNDDFYNEAFSDEDKKLIQETKVVNKKNSSFDTKGGNDTKDNVYLLSLDEAFDYYMENGERITTLKDGTIVWWWLRSPGFEAIDAANIGDYGIINKAGHKVFDESSKKGGIRPVIHVKLK